MLAPIPYLTPDEYLELETHSPIKHEYFDGEAFAMAGASDAHVTISLNLASELRSHVRGSGGRAFISDLKVRIESRDRFFYPDVLVTCDPRDTDNRQFKCFPKLIVEVLSPSTESFDRGDKFSDYRQLDSLQEYVLISSQHRRVEVFRRHRDGLWLFQSYEDSPDNAESFTLHSIGYTGTFATLYEDVVFESPAADPAEREDTSSPDSPNGDRV